MLSDIHEVCPSGYKRINDGSETSVSTLTAATSKLRQSLFYSPADGLVNSTPNSISGYYADGFFDRRQIKNSPTGDAATTVSYYPGTNNPLNAKNSLFRYAHLQSNDMGFHIFTCDRVSRPNRVIE